MHATRCRCQVNNFTIIKMRSSTFLNFIILGIRLDLEWEIVKDINYQKKVAIGCRHVNYRKWSLFDTDVVFYRWMRHHKLWKWTGDCVKGEINLPIFDFLYLLRLPGIELWMVMVQVLCLSCYVTGSGFCCVIGCWYGCSYWCRSMSARSINFGLHYFVHNRRMYDESWVDRQLWIGKWKQRRCWICQRWFHCRVPSRGRPNRARYVAIHFDFRKSMRSCKWSVDMVLNYPRVR